MNKNKKNINLDSDSELLRQYLNTGNLEILGELYNQYIHLVYGVCLKYLNNREESKDAVNRIFENLIVEIPKFDIQNFRSWLYVVTKNHCLMEIRKRKSEKRRFEKYSEIVFMESTDISHPIDEASDKTLEKHFGPEYAQLLLLMGAIRKKLLAQAHAPEAHKQLFEQLLNSDILELLHKEKREEINSLFYIFFG